MKNESWTYIVIIFQKKPIEIINKIQLYTFKHILVVLSVYLQQF